MTSFSPQRPDRRPIHPVNIEDMAAVAPAPAAIASTRPEPIAMRPKPKPSRDVAAEITNLIIRKLEEGVAPWSRPWRVSGAGGRPLRHCGTPYTGINTVYLWAIADANGYRSRYWMTYRQAEALGANVRRGESGSLSVYYSSFRKTESNPVTGAETEKNIRFLRHYVVFNADQIDGLPAYFYPGDETGDPVDPSARQCAIDAFFSAIPADVRHGGDRAFFHPTFDYGRYLNSQPVSPTVH